jgi:hypothetical protein
VRDEGEGSQPAALSPPAVTDKTAIIGRMTDIGNAIAIVNVL